MPGNPHFVQGRRAGRPAKAHQLVQARGQEPVLRYHHPQEVLLVGQVTNDPTDAVHWLHPANGILG
jgi:hypothetical protein